MRQTQFNQETRYQEQIREMEAEKSRLMNSQYPYQPHTADYPKRQVKGVVYKEKNITNVEQKQTIKKFQKKQNKPSILKTQKALEKEKAIEAQEIKSLLK